MSPTDLLIDGLKVLTVGVLVGAGVRAAEWVIPAPEMRVVVCTPSAMDHIEACVSAEELLNKRAGISRSMGM